MAILYFLTAALGIWNVHEDAKATRRCGFASIICFVQQWRPLLKDQEKEKLLELIDKLYQQMAMHSGQRPYIDALWILFVLCGFL